MKSGTLEEIQNAKATTLLQGLILQNSGDATEQILFELTRSGLHVNHTVAETREQFRAALAENNFDVVLADYRLLGWSALDALVELRGAEKDIPFLLITGTPGEEATVECIKQGASDCVLKDHLWRLPVVLMRALAEKNFGTKTLKRTKRYGLPKRATATLSNTPTTASSGYLRTADF